MRYLWFILVIATLRGCGTAHAATPQEWLDIQETRWKSASIEPRREREVSLIAARIMASKARYDSVERETGVPWHVIAAIHNMESSGSFRHHLHEGSPLTGRTKWAPIGRPLTGTPPFAWEFSAKDALLYDRLHLADWSSRKVSLFTVERYNGVGYLRRGIPSPYLWAATSVERPGKYIADGKWSSTARSGQVGVAAIWKVMRVAQLKD